MGHSLSETTKRRLLTEVPVTFKTKVTKMSDTVETTTPTVEEVQTPEVATNGEAEAAPAETAPEVTNGATEEPSSNGSTEEATNGTTEAESTNGSTEAVSTESSNGTTETSEAAAEEPSTNGEAAETNEATKRKADTPADEETIEKIAKLKEAAAEVVAEAEKDLPSEPLTEAEATA